MLRDTQQNVDGILGSVVCVQARAPLKGATPKPLEE
jgi:hypothetical protein